MSKDLATIQKELGNLDQFVKGDEFLKLVNQEPPKAIVKDHPFAKGVKYISISDVERMMDTIFQEWNVEVLESGQVLNAIRVTVRVNYKHPVSGEWLHNDGIGAQAIQVDSGKDASELAAIKSNAIMLAMPAAKSYAIKDACEHIGKLFGRDLNRKDTMAFEGVYDKGIDMEAEKERIRNANSTTRAK